MKHTKIILYSGYVGSGRETLLKGAVKGVHERLGILTESFPKLEMSLNSSEEELVLVELGDGVVYSNCSKNQYVDALIEMMNYNLDYVFVEISGFGSPLQFKDTLSCVEGMTQAVFDFVGSIYLVDAVHFRTHEIAGRSVHKEHLPYADLVLINRVDCVDDKEIEYIEQMIMPYTRDIDVLKCVYCDIQLIQIVERVRKNKLLKLAEALYTVDRKSESMILTIEGEVVIEELQLFLNEIVNWAIRIKGFVVASNSVWHVDQIAGELRLSEMYYEGTLPKTNLTVIASKDMNIRERLPLTYKKYFSNQYELHYANEMGV